MKEKTQRILVTVIAVATLIGAVAALNTKKNSNVEEEEISLEYVENNKTLEDLLKDRLYDDNIDYINVINDYLSNYKDLKDIMYIKSVYMLLYNSDVEITKYLEELNTMLDFNQRVTCCDIDEWKKKFNNLIKVSQTKDLSRDAYESLGRLVLPLAAYTHTLNCPECEEVYGLENGSYNPDSGDTFKCYNTKVISLSRK